MPQAANDADKAATELRPTVRDGELRRYMDERFALVDDRLSLGDQRMSSIEMNLAKNTELTSDIHEILDVTRSGFKVLGWLGDVAKWVTKIAAAAGTIWGLHNIIKHGGGLPTDGK